MVEDLVVGELEDLEVVGTAQMAEHLEVVGTVQMAEHLEVTLVLQY